MPYVQFPGFNIRSNLSALAGLAATGVPDGELARTTKVPAPRPQDREKKWPGNKARPNLVRGGDGGELNPTVTT